MTKPEHDKRFSIVIESMRFPLITLVIFAHMLPFATPQITFAWNSHDMYTLFSEMISHNLARLSVRFYFLIAGFYFFKKSLELVGAAYVTQLKKKIRTLVVPYLIWCLILVGAVVGKHFLFVYLGLGPDEGYAMIRETSWFDLLWTLPINFPLWYMRDLMCMMLLSPLFYLLFRYLKIYGLVILGLLYLAVWELGIAGLSTTAILFFGIGAYMAMYKVYPLHLGNTGRKIVYALSFTLLLVATSWNGMEYHEHIVRLFILFGVFALIYVFDYLAGYKRLREMLIALAPTTFFIYVVHQIYIINWMKGGWLRFFTTTDHAWYKLLGYFVVPFVCIAVCILIFFLFRKVFPRLFAISTGDRGIAGAVK